MLLSLLFCGSIILDNAMAGEVPSDPDKWKITGEVYLWGAKIGGESASGSDFEIDFDEILDDLEMAFMGNVTARRNKWVLLTDVIYLNISDSGSNAVSIPAGPFDPSIKVDAKVDLKAWITNALAGYTLIENESGRHDLMGGARYLHLNVKVKVDLDGAGPRPGVSEKIEDSGSNWDGIVGVRGHFNLAKNWYLPYYADVGTGGSQITYQALAGVGYRFKAVDVVATYRYLKWKFDNNDVLDELDVKGPMIGVKYAF
jgi:hypothetical protein